MTRNSPKSIEKLLSTGRLARLAEEARSRRETVARVRALLPAEEADHLVSAHVEANGRIVLVMDSPAWAARVRYRRASLGARDLIVRVAPVGQS
jgi:hypothetical protein